MEEALIEMYLAGVSVRRVEDITEQKLKQFLESDIPARKLSKSFFRCGERTD